MHRYFCRPSVRVIRTFLEQKSPKDFFFCKIYANTSQRSGKQGCFFLLACSRDSVDGHRRTKGKSRRSPKKSRDVSGKQRDCLVKAPPAASVGHAPLHRRTWDRLQGQIQTRGAPRRGISRASRPLRDRAVTLPQTNLSLRSPQLCVLRVEEKTRCI